jgi:hypothetical protein
MPRLIPLGDEQAEPGLNQEAASSKRDHAQPRSPEITIAPTTDVKADFADRHISPKKRWLVVRPGLFFYVVTTAPAAAAPTGFLRRRTAAEMSVITSPTGSGSMNV